MINYIFVISNHDKILKKRDIPKNHIEIATNDIYVYKHKGDYQPGSLPIQCYYSKLSITICVVSSSSESEKVAQKVSIYESKLSFDIETEEIVAI
jgi:hypothetical protein